MEHQNGLREPLLAAVSVCFELADASFGSISRAAGRVSSLLDGRQRQQPQISATQRLQLLKPVAPGKAWPSPRQLVAHELRAETQGSLFQFRPKGPGNNDRTFQERSLNVLTSLPFLFVGANLIRNQSSVDGKTFGITTVAVGCAATAYHSSCGQLRKHLRKLDHWTISLSSLALTRAIFPHASRVTQLVSLANLPAVPFQPFLVSTANLGVMEAEYLRSAVMHRPLRKAYCVHALLAAMGGSCYLLEDAAISRDIHLVHSLWHVLACYTVSSAGRLISHKQQLWQTQQRLHADVSALHGQQRAVNFAYSN